MNPIVRKSLIFGSIAGGVCFLFFLVMYFLNPNPLALRRPDLGINIIFIGVVIWYYKRENGGYLHFYEGFSLGFLTNIIAALLTGVLIFLFLQYVDVRPFEEWTAWLEALLGLWNIIAPWALGFAALSVFTWSSVIVGIALIVSAIGALSSRLMQSL